MSYLTLKSPDKPKNNFQKFIIDVAIINLILSIQIVQSTRPLKHC
jgi:hypothetical protein